MKRIGLILFMLLILVACNRGPEALPPTPDLSFLDEFDPGWTKIEPGGETRCAHDTPYAFWFHPGSSNDLLIYFQGGGGCYDAATCSTAGSYKEAVTDRDDPNLTGGGIFDLDHKQNPFREHSMLYIPYCTGDVHSGNRVANYTTAGGRNFDIYHHGYINANVALEWIYARFDQPDQIFVTGCSAGSVGSILHAPHIINQYPNSRVAQLGDSAGGLTSMIEWNIDGDYNAGRTFPSWIPGLQTDLAQNFTISKFYNAIANFYPDTPFAQYNAIDDATQRRYYVADGGQPADFPTAMAASLNEIHTQSPNFHSYTVPGERHCILKHTTFYTETVHETTLRDWVDNLANQKPVENVR